MSEFLAMGGYGAFVWGAFAISFAALSATTYLVKRSLKQTQMRLRRRLYSMEG